MQLFVKPIADNLGIAVDDNGDAALWDIGVFLLKVIVAQPVLFSHVSKEHAHTPVVSLSQVESDGGFDDSYCKDTHCLHGLLFPGLGVTDEKECP